MGGRRIRYTTSRGAEEPSCEAELYVDHRQPSVIDKVSVNLGETSTVEQKKHLYNLFKEISQRNVVTSIKIAAKELGIRDPHLRILINLYHDYKGTFHDLHPRMPFGFLSKAQKVVQLSSPTIRNIILDAIPYVQSLVRDIYERGSFKSEPLLNHLLEYTKLLITASQDDPMNNQDGRKLTEDEKMAILRFEEELLITRPGDVSFDYYRKNKFLQIDLKAKTLKREINQWIKVIARLSREFESTYFLLSRDTNFIQAISPLDEDLQHFQIKLLRIRQLAVLLEPN